MAWRCDLTFGPRLEPECKVPVFHSCITWRTLSRGEPESGIAYFLATRRSCTVSVPAASAPFSAPGVCFIN